MSGLMGYLAIASGTAVGLAIVGAVFWGPLYGRSIVTALQVGNLHKALRRGQLLRYSWTPWRVLLRRIARGNIELYLANVLSILGQPHEALECCEAGLDRCDADPAKRLGLHMIAAICCAEQGESGRMSRHLGCLHQPLADGWGRGMTYADVAVGCHLRIGRIDDAVRLLRADLASSAQRNAASQVVNMLSVLDATGQAAETFRLGKRLLNSDFELRSPTPAGCSPRTHLSILNLVLVAATQIDRWDLCCDFVNRFVSGPLRPVGTVLRSSVTSRLQARAGDKEGIGSCARAVEELIFLHDYDRTLARVSCGWLAVACQDVGEHDEALRILAWLSGQPLAPLGRSRMAVMAARSLDALGRSEEADTRRREARALAPLAAWNRGEASPPLPDEQELLAIIRAIK